MHRFEHCVRAVLSAACQVAVVLALVTGSNAQVSSTSFEKRPQGNQAVANTKTFSLPLMFEQYTGQEQHKFISRGDGYSIVFDQKQLVVRVSDGRKESTVSLQFDGSSKASFQGAQPLSAHTNYFLGKDPAAWRVGMLNFEKLSLTGVYPGIDLVFYGNHQQLEHDFLIAPYADPSHIQLKIAGARKLQTSDGDLLIVTEAGVLRFRRPYAYQEINGVKTPTPAQFKLKNRNTVSFSLGRYDRQHALVIDPVLVFATYAAGSTGSTGSAVAVDANGNTYITGSTTSTSFGSGNETAANPGGGTDAYLARFDATANGSKLAWITFFGGSGDEKPQGLALDVNSSSPNPNVYVSGFTTHAGDFPVTASSAYQSTSTAAHAGFVARFDQATGGLNYGSFLGGTGTQTAAGIGTDSTGLIYVAGSTDTGDMPTSAHSFQPVFTGTTAGYALVIKPAVSGSGALQYGTFVAGQSSSDSILVNTLAIGAPGTTPQIFVAGTASGSVPAVPSGFHATQGNDAFVMKINPAGGNGSDLIYATTIGGSGDDRANALTLGIDTETAFVAGSTTSSSGIATTGVFQPTLGDANGDGFIAVLDPVDGHVTAATYLGGTAADTINAIAHHPVGAAIVVAGNTSSTDIPVTGGFSAPHTSAASNSGFIAALSSNLTTAQYLTYLGGSSADVLNGIAVTQGGHAVTIGTFASTDAPVTNSAFQTTGHAPAAAYVAEFASDPAHTAPLTITAGASSPSPDPIGFSTSPAFASVLKNTWTITNTDSTNDATSVVFNSPIPTSGGLRALDPATYAATVSGVPGSCTTNSGGVTCVVPVLTAGHSAGIQVTATVNANVNNGPTLAVTGKVADAQNGSDTATQTSNVSAVVPLTLNFTQSINSASPTTSPVTVNIANAQADSPANPQIVTYALSATNADQVNDAPGVTIDLQVDATFTPATLPAGCAASGPTHITCTIGTVAHNSTSSPLTISGTFNASAVPAAQATHLFNHIATLSGTVTPATTQSLSVTVQRAAHLVGVKTQSPSTVNLDEKTTNNVAGVNDTVTYTLTVGNSGPDDASSVIVTDTLPRFFFITSAVPGNCSGTFKTSAADAVNTTTTLVCTFSSLAAGTASAGNLSVHGTAGPGAAVIVISGKFAANFPVGATGQTSVLNTLSANAQIVDAGPVSDNSGSVTTTVQRAAHLVITKLEDKTTINLDERIANNAPGTNDQVTYTLRIGNSGPNDASNVTVTDTLPPFFFVTSTPPNNCSGNFATSAQNTVNTTTTFTCTIATLAAGSASPGTGNAHGATGNGATVITLSGKFAENAALGLTGQNTFTNSVSGSAEIVDNGPATDNSDSQVVTVQRTAHLVLVKTQDKNSINLDERTNGNTPGANDTVTYILSIGNSGPNDASNVVVTNTLPAYFFITSSTPAGCSGNFANSANTAVSTTTTMTCNVATLATGTAIAGSGANHGTTGNGASVFTFTGKFVDNGANADIVPAAAASAIANNAASATAAIVDTGLAADHNSAQNITVQRLADIVVNISPDTTGPVNLKNAAHTNDTVTYTVTVTNNGPNIAVKTALTTNLVTLGFSGVGTIGAGSPAATCDATGTGCSNITAIDKPDTFTYKVTGQFNDCTIVAGQPQCPQVLGPNTASASAAASANVSSASIVDTVTGNNSKTNSTLTVQRLADLAVNIAPSTTGPVNLQNANHSNDTVTYTLTITNNGPNVATNAALATNLVTIGMSGTGAGTGSPVATCDGTGNGCSNIPALDIAQAFTYQVTGQFKDCVISAGQVVCPQVLDANTPSAAVAASATVSSTSVVDTVNGNNTKPDSSLTVQRSAAISISISPLKPDDTPLFVAFGAPQTGINNDLRYRVHIANAGPNNATHLILSNTLPAGLSVAPTSQVPVSGGALLGNCDSAGSGCADLTFLGATFTQDYVINGVFPTAALGATLNFDTTKNLGSQVHSNAIVDSTTKQTNQLVTLVNTATGTSVSVVPEDVTSQPSTVNKPAVVTFSAVSTPGTTSLRITSSGPALPAKTRFGNVIRYYNLSTDAGVSSQTQVTLCLSDIPTNSLGQFVKPERVRMFVLQGGTGGPAAGDKTINLSGQLVVPVNKVTAICGTFSGFAVAVQQPSAPGATQDLIVALLEPQNRPAVIPDVSQLLRIEASNPSKGSSGTAVLLNLSPPNPPIPGKPLQRIFDPDDQDGCFTKTGTQSGLVGKLETGRTCSDNSQLVFYLTGPFSDGTTLKCFLSPLNLTSDPTTTTCIFPKPGISPQDTNVQELNVANGQGNFTLYVTDQTYHPGTKPDQVTLAMLKQDSGVLDGISLPASFAVSNLDITPGTNTSNTATITAGQTANTAVIITGDPGPIQLTCAVPNAPGVSCSLAPIQSTAGGPITIPANGQVAVSLFVKTTGTSFARTVPYQSPRNPVWPAWYGWTAVPVAGFVLIASLHSRRFSRKQKLVFIAAGLVVSMALIGCGGGNIGSGSPQQVTTATPAGTYIVTVSGTGSNLQFDAGDGTGQLKSTYTFTVNVK